MIDGVDVAFTPQQDTKLIKTISGLRIGEIGILYDDDEEEDLYFVRLSNATVICLTNMTLASSTNLLKKCKSLPSGKLTITLDYEG